MKLTESQRRHEEKHVRVARALGHDAHITLDRNGEVCARVTYRHDPSPVERAAIALASSDEPTADTRRDRAMAEAALSEVPWSQRGKARREAERLARKHR